MLIDEPGQCVVLLFAVQQIRVHEPCLHLRDGSEVEVFLGLGRKKDVDVHLLIKVMGVRRFEAVVLDDVVASQIVALVRSTRRGNGPRMLDDVVDGEIEGIRPIVVDFISDNPEKAIWAHFLRIVGALQKPLVRIAIVGMQANYAAFYVEAAQCGSIDRCLVFFGQIVVVARECAFPNVDLAVRHAFIRRRPPVHPSKPRRHLAWPARKAVQCGSDFLPLLFIHDDFLRIKRILLVPSDSPIEVDEVILGIAYGKGIRVRALHSHRGPPSDY